MFKGWAHLFHEKRLRELGLLRLEKERTERGHYQCTEVSEVGGAKRMEPCSAGKCQAIGQEARKRMHRKLPLKMRKNFITVQLTDHWNRLLRKVVESSFLADTQEPSGCNPVPCALG